MKTKLRHCLCAGCILFAINFCEAQPVVTEYFVMKQGFKIDLTDKKVQKTIYIKGVLDVVYSTSNLTLSITYDPHTTTAIDAMKAIQEVAGASAFSVPQQQSAKAE